ncbi:ectonucleoside triphosphate diphosphohydrolase 8 [Antechinus flavipes]|uniref:ectonucleoside triphosphate diphosphohydrolase 8 n=1 Tax=Antechinus flavipes TaxID=38775 RepID=UPI0022357407|nr:ectonucleoside triphosphate diphosphohydrolase 8 [Antechinus flavipes]XP_051832873.1 ectonucleoside triphosphate diphosphohydrolase 8 [Antechinus flavipes]XP_051832874.1 ectonucleoside triphosphate diphosphohydrolase 8 [Antechinus flavipes]
MGISYRNVVFSVFLGATIIAGIIALIVFLVGGSDIVLPPETKYGMVFDAGSSHTSLYVYKWPANKENDTGIVSQTLLCNVEGPGISHYVNDPVKAGESLRACMEKALTLIPEDRHQETPTFLGATAGMRLLREKNSSQADRIFEEISKTLNQFPVNFQGAQILTGKDEGSFGWITVNYILGTLVKYSFSGEWIQPPMAEMVGALDLGGASTQISFLPLDPIADPSTQGTFRLYGFNYSIYTHSYLCYGQNQMQKRLLAHLVQIRPFEVVRNPCYHGGYEDMTSLADLYDTPCVQNSQHFGLPRNVKVEGTGNPEACYSAIYSLFNFSTCQDQKDCAFDGIYQPQEHGQFYAFAGFYYTFHFLNLTDGQSLYTVNRTIWEFCQKPWKQVEANYPEQKQRLPTYCTNAMYILILLTRGYKFDDATWNNIHFRRQAAGTDIGWTLGYMLNMTNMIPAEAPVIQMTESYGVWIAGIFFIVLAILTSIIFGVIYCFWSPD